jgi:guanylate kinase
VSRLLATPFPLIFAAPSGAGKTTIARTLKERRGDVEFSVSATTRAPRSYEVNERDYHFVSDAEFRRMIDAGELVEWAEVHGSMYGTPRRNLEDAAARGMYLILDIDVQGARQIRQAVPDAIGIFILPPSGEELASRLAGRGTEDEAVRIRRLTNARREIGEASQFDYVIVNEDLEQSVRAVEAIIAAESIRVGRVRTLKDTVDHICAEVDERLRSHASGGTS